MKHTFFRAFFGVNPNSIREIVVLSPVIYPGQFEKAIGEKGKRYKSILGYLVSNFKKVTFIKTPMTQSAVSDIVLMLEETRCKSAVFVGAMGGLRKNLRIGDVVVLRKARDVYSVKSIHEEIREKLISLQKKGVQGIDFESRAFFKAAKRLKLSAVAYYVVTDLPLTKPFYERRSRREETRVQKAIKQIGEIVWRKK